MNFNLILKYKGRLIRIISLIFCILLAESINAQSPIPDSLKTTIREVIKVPSQDTTSKPTQHAQSLDSLKTVDTLEAPKRDIESRINYNCRDSLRMDVVNQKVYLYGNSKVIYGTRIIEAEYLEINWATNEVKAYGYIDSTGKTIGRPVFKDGADMYTAEEIRYNMKSGKGIIKGIVTKQGDGYIHGGPVKKTPEAIYVKHALYTTCDLPHPHFSINASQLKVIPADKVVTGPFHMEIMGIPTPLGLPLGFFPVTKRSKSGIIMPTIGENRSRGFFLSNGGYYLALNDYVGMKFVGDVYANKSYRVSNNTVYTKRYGYNGAIAANYSSTKENFVDSVPFLKTMNFTWNHNQIANRPARFSANVNVSSSKYYQSTSYNPTNLMSSSFTSTVSWAKTFRNSPFSLSIAARQDQNVATKVMNVTAPAVSLMMNRVYIFKKKSGDGTKWHEKIYLTYNGTGQMDFKNVIATNATDVDTLKSFDAIVSNGQWGATNTISTGTTIKLLKYFSLNPAVNGQVYFYDRTVSHSFDPTTKILTATTHMGFAAAYSYNFSTNLTTRIYGMYRLNNAVLKAIRHTLIPTATYTYAPDFSESKYGFYDVYNDPVTQKPLYKASHFLGAGPSAGQQNILSFNLQNTLEGKVRNRKDTTGTNGLKIVKLLENLAVAGSYNFTADTCQWSPVTLNANSRFFNKVTLAFNSTFDPYKYTGIYNSDKTLIRYQRTAQANSKFLSLLRYSLSLNTSLNPNAKGGGVSAVPITNPNNIPGVVQTFGSPYVDFTIPWNLTLGYNLTFDKTLVTTPFQNSLTFSGDIKISDNWKFVFQSGYDFSKQGLTQATRISIYRDLHCWQMSMSIMPLGTQQSFMFTLNAKSSLLRDLKLTKQNPSYFGGY